MEEFSEEFPDRYIALVRDWSDEDQDELERRLNDERLRMIEERRAALRSARERGEDISSHRGDMARFHKRPEPERN